MVVHRRRRTDTQAQFYYTHEVSTAGGAIAFDKKLHFVEQVVHLWRKGYAISFDRR